MQTPDVERAVGDDVAKAQACETTNSRYSLIVHSVRKTLADIDGISAKAALDGVVRAGLLPDDNHKIIEKVSYTQEKCKKLEEEKTILEFIPCQTKDGPGIAQSNPTRQKS